MGSLSFLKRQQRELFSLACIAAAGALAMQATHAAGFQGNDLVVVQVNNATQAASSVNILGFQATPTAATADTSVALSTSLSLPGTSDHDGQISLSTNGQVLALGVYGYAAGSSTNPATLSAAAANRDIITLNAAGTVRIAATLTNSYNGGGSKNAASLRSVATPDGTTFYLGGNDKGLDQTAGIQYVNTATSTTASTSLNNNATPSSGANGYDARTMTLYNGALYTSSGSDNGPYGQHATGSASGSNTALTLPTANPVTYVEFNTGSLNEPDMNQSPVFFSNGHGNPDLMYVSDSTNSSLDKWSLVNGTWTQNGSIAISGIEDVAARNVNGTFQIFVTTSTHVYGIADTAGYSTGADSAFSALAPTTLLTASGSSQFRGAALMVPEPASLGVLALGGVATLLRRRRKA